MTTSKQEAQRRREQIRTFKEALRKPHLLTLRHMLDQGFASIMPTDLGKQTLLLTAQAGYLPVVEQLLAAGVDPNCADADGETPLHAAAVRSRSPDIVKALLKAGAHPDGTPEMCPLRHIITQPDIRIIRILLDAGADPNLPRYQHSSNALHHCVQCGYKDVIEALLAAGVSITSVDDRGYTPLHYATTSSMGEGTIELLAQHAAPIEARSKSGLTPLLSAARNGQGPAFMKLVKLGADPLVRDNEGADAVQLALTTTGWSPDKEKIALWMLERHPHLAPTGAALDQAFVMAVSSGLTDLVKKLAELGADVGQKPGGRTLMQCAPAKNEELKRVLRSLKTGASIGSAMNTDGPSAPAPRLDSSIL